MPEMTKEQLGKIIEEKALAQAQVVGAEITESLKGELKEMIQEAIKDVGNKAPEFEDVHPELDPKGGFTDVADFFKGVYDCGAEFANLNTANTDGSVKMKKWLNQADNILAGEKAVGSPSQNATSLTAGGALIPPEFSRTSLVMAKERSSIMQDAMVLNMQTNHLDIPYLGGLNESQGLSAGNIKFRWLAEQEEGTGNQAQMKMVSLTLSEANAMVYISNQMMDFSPISIVPFVTKGVENALDLALSNAFINGTGVGQPQGVMNADCLVSVAKETNQLADTFVLENSTKMFARHYGEKGRWYANKTVFPQLTVMNVAVGAGGSAVYLGAGQSVAGAPNNQLHGIPLEWTSRMKQLGDAGDIGLFDFSQYLIGQLSGKSGLMTAESAHLKFDFRQHAFSFGFYIDGRAWWPSAFTPLNGDSQSPFVALAARA